MTAPTPGRRRPVRQRILGGLWCLLCSFSAWSAPPLRVASINLCTDSMLLELADTEQIVSLTTLARDQDLSYFAERAKAYPVNHGQAEEILLSAPDLILAARYSATTTTALLERLGYRVVYFDPIEDLAGFRRSFTTLAQILGHPERATRLLATMDARLQAASAKPRAAVALRALFYQPNGYAPGRSTLVDDVMDAAHLTNLLDEIGPRDGGFMSLETLLISAPNLLITSQTYQHYPALANELVKHPALTASMRPGRSLVPVNLPERLWTCGGTYFAEAVERLVSAAATLGE